MSRGFSSDDPTRGPPPDTTESRIRAHALDIGFDTIGFTAADLSPRIGAHLAAFLKDGRHGTMKWMEETQERRRHPQALWPQAVSSIALGVNYGPATDPLPSLHHREHGYISVYARHRDYHDLLRKRLKQLARWIAGTFTTEVKVFVDTAPLMEKPLAAQAGIGWQGKHTNLVSRTHGSWLFLGHILTTLPLAPDPPQRSLCGSCQRCLSSCPTGALDQACSIDPRTCIAYLTIEYPGPIPFALRPLIGNRIYGCDDCLGVCPWNRFASPTRHDAFLPRPSLISPPLNALAALSDQDFRTLFSGSPIKRIGRDRFIRNILIALGNSRTPSLAPIAARLRNDPSPLVAGTAIWAWASLSSPSPILKEAEQRLRTPLPPFLQTEWEWARQQAIKHGQTPANDRDFQHVRKTEDPVKTTVQRPCRPPAPVSDD